MVLSFFMYQLPVFAAISAGVYALVNLFRRSRIGKRPMPRHIANVTLICYGISLVYLTLLWYYPFITFDPGYHSLNLVPFIWVKETYEMGVAKMLTQLALNVGMFLPLGFLLPVVFPRMRNFFVTSAVTLAVTLLIETLQYFMGRSADVDDLLTNLIGGMIGCALYFLCARLFATRPFWRKLCGESACAEENAGGEERQESKYPSRREKNAGKA